MTKNHGMDQCVFVLFSMCQPRVCTTWWYTAACVYQVGHAKGARQSHVAIAVRLHRPRGRGPRGRAAPAKALQPPHWAPVRAPSQAGGQRGGAAAAAAPQRWTAGGADVSAAGQWVTLAVRLLYVVVYNTGQCVLLMKLQMPTNQSTVFQPHMVVSYTAIASRASGCGLVLSAALRNSVTTSSVHGAPG